MLFRSLRNVIERAVILCEREFINEEDIVLSKLELNPHATPVAVAAPAPAVASALPEPELDLDPPSGETSFDPRYRLWDSLIQAGRNLDDVERLYIEAVLRSCAWNKSQAARMLGIERTTLDRRLKKYGFARPEGEEGEESADDGEG